MSYLQEPRYYKGRMVATHCYRCGFVIHQDYIFYCPSCHAYLVPVDRRMRYMKHQTRFIVTPFLRANNGYQVP